MSASLVGAIVATAAVFFVLWPLFAAPRSAPRSAPRDTRRVPSPADSAGSALREIEFDHATGKLEPADYETLKTVYSARALAELRVAASAELPAGANTADAAETLISAVRNGRAVCAACGAACPEPDAAFCSTCGARLAAKRD